MSDMRAHTVPLKSNKIVFVRCNIITGLFSKIGLVWLNPLKCFFGSEGHVALDRNPGPGYDTLLLRMIPGDLLSAFPHRQYHTLPSLLDNWAALPNSNPNACVLMQGGSLYHFYDGLWYDPAERQTHDLPCKRRTRYQLSQPDTVYIARMFLKVTYLYQKTSILILKCSSNAFLGYFYIKF